MTSLTQTLRSLSALFIAIAVIAAAVILGGAWKRTHFVHGNEVSVTGSSSEDFTSDLVVWSGSYSEHSMVLKDAYEALKRDAAIVKTYLAGKSVTPDEMVFGSTSIIKDFRYSYNANGATTGQEFNGYTLTQSVRIESKQVDKVEKVSREVTELIDQGLELYSEPPMYYYTKLADLKIKMLASASEDGRNRAEQIATKAGAGLGSLKNAAMGVFQITGQNSGEDYSFGGAFNTSNKQKTASITVRLDFDVK